MGRSLQRFVRALLTFLCFSLIVAVGSLSAWRFKQILHVHTQLASGSCVAQRYCSDLYLRCVYLPPQGELDRYLSASEGRIRDERFPSSSPVKSRRDRVAIRKIVNPHRC